MLLINDMLALFAVMEGGKNFLARNVEDIFLNLKQKTRNQVNYIKSEAMQMISPIRKEMGVLPNTEKEKLSWMRMKSIVQ